MNASRFAMPGGLPCAATTESLPGGDRNVTVEHQSSIALPCTARRPSPEHGPLIGYSVGVIRRALRLVSTQTQNEGVQNDLA